jgi:alpha-1,3-rhamnosyl/mannosyltransferase
MHIGLNLLYASPAIGGAWRYIQNVLQMIQKYDRQNSYSLFLYAGKPLPLAAPSSRMQLHFVAPGPIASRWMRVLHEQTEVPRLAEQAGCDLVHSFGNVAVMRRGIRNVVTVHDLKPYARNEGALPSARDLYVRAILPASLRRSACVLPISQFTATVLETRFHVEGRKVITVPNVVDERFRRSSEAEVASLRERWHLPPNFWLYVANFYPHKNHARFLLAYEQYRRRHGHGVWPLVLCGSPGLQYDRIRDLTSRLGVAEDVHFIHGLHDTEMPALYSAASALVFPSMYEGFGIPLLEAMACGCPIAASDIPAVGELATESSICFDPESLGSMADAMLRLEHDRALRITLGEAGQRTAEGYRDNVVIQQLMDAYDRGGQA